MQEPHMRIQSDTVDRPQALSLKKGIAIVKHAVHGIARTSGPAGPPSSPAVERQLFGNDLRKLQPERRAATFSAPRYCN